MTRRFLIPKDYRAESFEAFRSAWMDALATWSQRFSRQLVFVGRETPSTHSEEWVFRDDGSGTTLRLVRDWRMPPVQAAVCYAALTGVPEVIDPLVADAWDWAWQHDLSSITARTADELATDPSSILLLALAGAGLRPNQAADAVMRASFTHADALVRYVAVFAVQQVGWLEYLPLVEAASVSDTDENVRMLALETLVTLRGG